PKRVPSSVVRCLSLIEKARPSNRYCTARALATWRARKSTVKARPAAKSSVHSSFSKAKKGRRSPESAHFNAASKACWTSRRFSSRFVIGARVPFGWFLISQPNICRRDARPLTPLRATDRIRFVFRQQVGNCTQLRRQRCRHTSHRPKPASRADVRSAGRAELHRERFLRGGAWRNSQC